MNPRNGPETEANNNYVSAVTELRRSKGKVIGYVYTSYAKRAADVVRQDIDRYFSFYEIDGIFFDVMTNDSEAQHVAYYRSLYQYVKDKNQAHIGDRESRH
jgi:hypothetical protein